MDGFSTANDNFSYNSRLENHSPEIYFRLNQDNAKWPRKPYFPEKIISNKWKYFKFLITYAHLKQQSLLENIGTEIPFPVCSPKNGFS